MAAHFQSHKLHARSLVENGMIVKTHLTSEVADKAQKGIMELLLINHPLDCPVCDKGGAVSIAEPSNE
jgi:predicted molibdopterin-dependent oxidoreductase YjgC